MVGNWPEDLKDGSDLGCSFAHGPGSEIASQIWNTIHSVKYSHFILITAYLIALVLTLLNSPSILSDAAKMYVSLVIEYQLNHTDCFG